MHFTEIQIKCSIVRKTIVKIVYLLPPYAKNCKRRIKIFIFFTIVSSYI